MEQTDQSAEAAAILRLIARESEAFWNKDYDAWAQCCLHAPYVRVMGWWARGGVTVIEGWDALSERMKENMRANPEPNPTASQVRRENINLRIAQEMAWVTFDQYGQDTGEPDMDMPGVSRETRILEKHNGEWKIVYGGWLLEGEAT
jgi:SnoaL-like domain